MRFLPHRVELSFLQHQVQCQDLMWHDISVNSQYVKVCFSFLLLPVFMSSQRTKEMKNLKVVYMPPAFMYFAF